MLFFILIMPFFVHQPAGLVKGITGKREPMKTENMKDSHNEAEEGTLMFAFFGSSLQLGNVLFDP